MKTLKESYDGCIEEGYIKKQDNVDIDLIKSLLIRAKEGIEAFNGMEKIIKYAFILLQNKYDILRELVSAFLLFDKIKSSNHLCLFAFLCTEHSELELNWDDFEMFRILRNKVCYEGKEISEKDWKNIKVRFDIYIRTFIKEIEKKLEEYKLTHSSP